MKTGFRFQGCLCADNPGTGNGICKPPTGQTGTEPDTVNFRDPQTPMGTIVLLIVFAIFIIGMWTNAYLVLLSRGVTR